MRKLLGAALVAAMVFSLVGVAHGEDYRARALEHLRAKYGSVANEIELHEGGLTRLELTGETFWMAKYFSGQSSSSTGSAPSGSGSSPASPSGKDIQPTLPDQTVPSTPPPRGTTLPSPPDGYIAPAADVIGLIAIRLSTGAILDGPQMEAFYKAEQTAWERSAAEARVSVVIQPSIQISQEILAKVAELRAKHPLVAKGLTLSDEQLLGGGGVASDLPVTFKAEPAITIAPSPSQPPVLSEQDAAYRQQAEAFFTALGQLRLEAVRESVKAIEVTLAAMGVKPATEPSDQVVRAELTAREIESIATHHAVDTIFEHMTALPAAGFGREPVSGTQLKASDTVKRQATEASVVSALPRGSQLAGGALVITSLLIGAFALVKRRSRP